jgi:oligoribonuclease
MKYVSIDIETTGLDPVKDQILSIGAVIEDTTKDTPLSELPRIHLVIQRDRIEGNPFACSMNWKLLELMSRASQSEQKKTAIEMEHNMTFVPENVAAMMLRNFLEKNEAGSIELKSESFQPPYIKTTVVKIAVAGKNFATFDKLFLEQLPFWDTQIKVKSRVLDPAILFVDWENDKDLPNLQTCKERAHMDGKVAHDAIDDALDVIALMRYSASRGNVYKPF